MGYRVKRTVYKLTFEQHSGMEVRVKSVPLGDMMNATRSAVQLAGVTPETLTADAADGVNVLLDLFCSLLVSWNLEEEDGSPIPCTRDGLRSLDSVLAMEIFNAWQDAAGGMVPDASPLDSSSPNGTSTASLPDLDLPVSRLS